MYITDDGVEKFLKALNREKEPPTQAMLDGNRFEGLVNAALDGQAIPPDHEWTEPVEACRRLLDGSQQQVTLFKELGINGQPFLLHGVLDFLHKGQIYDTKYSKTYHRGKYLTSPQTPMYFRLCPEAYRFTYVICDGKYVYQESYTPDEVEPIERTIWNFYRFLENQNLLHIYRAKWRVNR